MSIILIDKISATSLNLVYTPTDNEILYNINRL